MVGETLFTDVGEGGRPVPPEVLAAIRLTKYSPDQPRDERGRFAAGDGGKSLDDLTKYIVGKWASGYSKDFRGQLAYGRAPHLQKYAEHLVNMVNTAKATAYPLYRGIGLGEQSYGQFNRDIKVGGKVDLNLSSWTRSENVATQFASNSFNTVAPMDTTRDGLAMHQVIFRMEPGASALDVTSVIPQGPQYSEHLSLGRFEVTGIDHVDISTVAGLTRDIVSLRQVGLLEPGQLRGTKVSKLERVADAHFLDWLEPYMDQRMVPPTPTPTLSDVSTKGLLAASRGELTEVSTDDLLKLAKLLTKGYSEFEARDEHGRWTADGDGPAETTASMKEAVGAFKAMPQVRDMTAGAAQRWFRDNANLYASNRDFRTLVAAGSSYVQGGYGPLRGAAEYAITGVLPPPSGMNEQAWRGYLNGERWRNDFGAAPEGAKDGERIKDRWGGRGLLVADGRLVGDWTPAPKFELAPTIGAYAARENSDTPAQQEKSTESTSYKEAGLALNTAIAASDPYEGTLYRGMRLSDGNYTLRDGTIYSNTWREYNSETGRYEYVRGEPGIKLGQTLELMGPTSFTSDGGLADRITAGRAKMGDNTPGAGTAALIFKVDGAQALNVQALSPYRQSEYLTSGRFTVTNIEQKWTTIGASSYYARRGDSIPQFVVTLKQEGTWRPPS